MYATLWSIWNALHNQPSGYVTEPHSTGLVTVWHRFSPSATWGGMIMWWRQNPAENWGPMFWRYAHPWQQQQLKIVLSQPNFAECTTLGINQAVAAGCPKGKCFNFPMGRIPTVIAQSTWNPQLKWYNTSDVLWRWLSLTLWQPKMSSHYCRRQANVLFLSLWDGQCPF